MAREKRASTAPSSYTYPHLHHLITAAVDDDVPSVHYVSSSPESLRDHSTSVMGSFTCPNHSCTTNRWSSKIIAIVINGYENNGYSVEVYGQRCRGCDELGRLRIDEQSYVDRVSYRVKKWAGISMERRDGGGRRDGPPHESALCEGCRAGVCREGDSV